jgi:hypothetical protein
MHVVQGLIIADPSIDYILDGSKPARVFAPQREAPRMLVSRIVKSWFMGLISISSKALQRTQRTFHRLAAKFSSTP